jgi:hypothetical protein
MFRLKRRKYASVRGDPCGFGCRDASMRLYINLNIIVKEKIL